MKVVHIVIVAILVFLAVSSGIAKILLMPQDAIFFGKYGFTAPLLVGFGVAQVIGGVMIVFAKSRVIGAVIVAITFAISLVLLVMESSVPASILTLVALAFLGAVIWHNRAGRLA